MPFDMAGGLLQIELGEVVVSEVVQAARGLVLERMRHGDLDSSMHVGQSGRIAKVEPRAADIDQRVRNRAR